jgi:hypothetical protein
MNIKTTIIPWLLFCCSLAMWGVFGFLVWSLYGERTAYVEAAAAAQEAGLRGESLSRLRALVEDTKEDRTSLETLLAIDILRAVQVLEETARQAGARDVVVGEANATAVGGKAPKNLSSVSVVINMGGSFSSLSRTMSLYETLTLPATLEQFDMEKVGSAWRATARVRVYLTQK